MPSIDDLFSQLQAVSDKLDQANIKLTQINATLETGFQNLSAQLIYADQALAHISKQDDTIICILEKISEQTCALLNEAHQQTALQSSLAESASATMEMYKTAHPKAALTYTRLRDLHDEILRCCPPETSPPICEYEPCSRPESLPDPPEAPIIE